MSNPRILPIGEEPTPTQPEPRAPAGARFKQLNTFIDFSVADLTRTEIAVWLVLFRDTREGTARTSMRDIARRAGCSVRAVGTAVARLEARGLLKVVHRGGMNRGTSRYRVRPLAKDA